MTTDWDRDLAWQHTFNQECDGDTIQLSPEMCKLLAYVSGNGAELIALLQKDENLKAQRKRNKIRRKKITAFIILLIWSSLVIVTIWKEGAVNWRQHWVMALVYLWSCNECQDAFKK